MKVAFVGFEAFAEHQHILNTMVTEYGHSVIDDHQQANVLLIPHHMDTLFPAQKPWIAVWVQGGTARMLVFANLTNKPREIIVAYNLSIIKVHQGRSLKCTLDKIAKG